MQPHAQARKPSGVGAGATRGGRARGSRRQSASDRGGARSQCSHGEQVVGLGPPAGARRVGCRAASRPAAKVVGQAAAVAQAATAQRGAGARLVDRLVDGRAGAGIDLAEVWRRISCVLRSRAAEGSGLDATEARTSGARTERSGDRALGARRVAADQKKFAG